MSVCVTPFGPLEPQRLLLPTQPRQARAAPGSREGGKGERGQKGPCLGSCPPSPLLWGPGRPQLSTTGRRLVGGRRTGTSGFPRWNRVAPGGWEGPICALQTGAQGSGGLAGSALPSPQPLLPPLSAPFPHQDHLLPRRPRRTEDELTWGARTQPQRRQLQVKLPSGPGAQPPSASPGAWTLAVSP